MNWVLLIIIELIFMCTVAFGDDGKELWRVHPLPHCGAQSIGWNDQTCKEKGVAFKILVKLFCVSLTKHLLLKFNYCTSGCLVSFWAIVVRVSLIVFLAYFHSCTWRLLVSWGNWRFEVKLVNSDKLLFMVSFGFNSTTQ